jgi:hypothetical protein
VAPGDAVLRIRIGVGLACGVRRHKRIDALDARHICTRSTASRSRKSSRTSPHAGSAVCAGSSSHRTVLVWSLHATTSRNRADPGVRARAPRSSGARTSHGSGHRAVQHLPSGSRSGRPRPLRRTPSTARMGARLPMQSKPAQRTRELGLVAQTGSQPSAPRRSISAVAEACRSRCL